MNIWDILILLVIAGIIIIAWRAAKGSGGCHESCGSCAGDCSSCGSASSCSHKDHKQDLKN
jgi:hypothetical protein